MLAEERVRHPYRERWQGDDAGSQDDDDDGDARGRDAGDWGHGRRQVDGARWQGQARWRDDETQDDATGLQEHQGQGRPLSLLEDACDANIDAFINGSQQAEMNREADDGIIPNPWLQVAAVQAAAAQAPAPAPAPASAPAPAERLEVYRCPDARSSLLAFSAT